MASKLFQPALTYPSGGLTALSIAVADVNRDGKPELIVANLCIRNPPTVTRISGLPSPFTDCTPNPCIDYVVVMLGNGDGTFAAPCRRGITRKSLQRTLGPPTSPQAVASLLQTVN